MPLAKKKLEFPTPETALTGRPEPIPTADEHFLFDRKLKGSYPEGSERAMFGLGCFWGAERKFWQLGTGIWITAVGYAAGLTPNPIYDEVSTGRTGHNEVVFVVFNPEVLSYKELLTTFWESHDPTQGLRQGNDVGTQYRSGIYTFSKAQHAAAQASKTDYQKRLKAAGFGEITTEIVSAPEFYFAEEDHQQYLAKVPHGYCGLGGTGVSCALSTGAKSRS